MTCLSPAPLQISGLIVHEGAAVYRVFKRWRAVNLHWDVLNYDKATDIEESSRESLPQAGLYGCHWRLCGTGTWSTQPSWPPQGFSVATCCICSIEWGPMKICQKITARGGCDESDFSVTKLRRCRCGPPCTFWNVIAMNGKTMLASKTHIYELFKIYAFYMNIWIANTFFWKRVLLFFAF